MVVGAGEQVRERREIHGRVVGRQREHVPRARRTERVTDRDGAAIGIQPVIRDLEAVQLVRELTQDAERLSRVRFVHFPYVDVGRRKAGARERPRDRVRRRDPHDLRVERVRCR